MPRSVPRLRGYRKGRPDEPYALVGVDVAPDVTGTKSVGTLDLLGREGTTSFVHDLTSKGAQVERVSKLEDLLPLLQLQRVDAILLPSRLVPDVQKLSAMKLRAKELDKRVGLVAVAVLSSAGNEPLAAVSKLKPSILQQLGIDGWA